MITLVVRDRVRDTDVEVRAERSATVSEVVDGLVATHGLPRTTPAGGPLRYDLTAAGSDEVWPPSATLAELGAADSTAVELTSPDARIVWARVRELSQALRAEVEAGIKGAAGAAQVELEAGAGRVKAQVHDEVRGLVREATNSVEREITRRIQGLARMLNLRARRAIRRYIGEVAATGAIPGEVRALSLAAGQLTSAARSALVAPLAGAVVVASAVAGTGAVVANNAQAAAREAETTADQAASALARIQDQLEVAVAELEQARDRANQALAALDEHQAADDPHGIEPLEQVAAEVGAVLQLAGEPGFSWVGALVDAADGRIDAHLSTEYVGGDGRMRVEPGDSLWRIAAGLLVGGAYAEFVDCPHLSPRPDPSVADIADYVGRLWVANVGVIGADANVISDEIELQVICPRSDNPAGN